MKKVLIIAGLIAIAIVGLYVYSIATKTIELQEESPLINDAMDSMDEATKADFEE